MSEINFSGLADAAAGRYALFLHGLRGIHASADARGNVVAPGHLEEVTGEGIRLARIYLDNEFDSISKDTSQIVSDAHQSAASALGVSASAELPERITELQGLSEEILRHAIILQTERDVAGVRQALRQSALEVELAALVQGISRDAALIQKRAVEPVAVGFTFLDRAGRNWQSQKYIRTIWRQHALTAWNETYLTMLAEHGIPLAEVDHPDSSSEWVGKVFSILPDSDWPSYAEIRAEVFHPNSDARVSLSELGA